MNMRMAAPGDIAALIRLRFDYFSTENLELRDDIKASITTQLQEYFPAHLNRDFHAVLVEDEDGKIVSTAFLVVFEKPANPSFPTGKTGLILNVFTYPEYRKRGCATASMKALIGLGKSLNLSYIELSASESGKPVYEKLGFQTHQSLHFTEMRLNLLP